MSILDNVTHSFKSNYGMKPSVFITGSKGFIASGLKGDGIDIKDGIDICTYKAKKKYFFRQTQIKTKFLKSVALSYYHGDGCEAGRACSARTKKPAKCGHKKSPLGVNLAGGVE